MNERQPAYDAVQRHLEAEPTNAIGQGAIWRAVNAALDAHDEHILDSMLRADTVWVISLDGVPQVVTASKGRAKRRLRTMIGLSGNKLSQYTITATDQEAQRNP